MTRMRAMRSGRPRAGTWPRCIRGRDAVCAVLTAAVLVAALAGCGTGPAPGAREGGHGPARSVLTATFRLPGVFGLAAGDGAAWVTTGNAVLRIDPRTDRASQVLSDPGASLTGIAFGAGSLWVEGDMGMLRVDPVTGKVTARIGVHVSALSFGEGALWALGRVGGGPLVRIDPATNAVTTFPLPPGKTWDLAAGEGAVWLSVAMPSAGLLRVDPATGRVIARIRGDDLFGQVAAGDGAVWASDGAAVARIDPRTGQVTATAWLLSPLPASGPSPVLNGSGLLAVVPGVVWVTRAQNARQASLLRLDPRTGRITGAGLGVGRDPQAVAASGTTVWLVTAAGLARVDLVTCGHSRCAAPAPPASVPAAPAPAWLDSLQMTSASTGWALRSTVSPWSTQAGYLVPVRTTDGARTWTDVTPSAAAALLRSPDATVVLDALGGNRAYMAVTAAGQNSAPLRTVVFGTGDAGQTWTQSAPLAVPAPVGLLSFAGPRDGWLLASSGGTMGQDPVWLYRTTDAGLRWSLVAATPQSGTGRNGLPVDCDKAGLAFATAQVGWLASACNGTSPDVLLVTRDGGAHWAPQPLPVPASAFCQVGCEVYSPPQFYGQAGFVVIGEGPDAPHFLASRDLGQTWQQEPLTPGAGWYPRITFFGPLDGVLVSAGAQGVIGGIIATTADGGGTWTTLRLGRSFGSATEFDFTSPRTGFAWVPADDTSPGSPAMAETTDSGLTWTSFTPVLAGG
jgi:hypothetical protein